MFIKSRILTIVIRIIFLTKQKTNNKGKIELMIIYLKDKIIYYVCHVTKGNSQMISGNV